MKINLSNGDSYEGELKADRDTMHPSRWRLMWQRPGTSQVVMAEGECSAIYYRTMRAAIAGGLKRFGVKATKYRA